MTYADLPRSRRTYLLILAAILLIGLILRLIRLDFQPLWWDEGYSVWFAGHPLTEMVRLTVEDIHPPLYYGLLHIWSLAMGLSPLSLRLFSLLVSLVAIPLAYVFGRDLHDHSTGLIAAAIVAVNPLAIFYSQEIRMYGLATSFSLLALWSGWRWLQPHSRRRFGIVYVLSLLSGLYTLYYFALIPLAQSVYMVLFARKRLIPWLITQVAALLFVLPWLWYAGPKLLDYVAYKVVQDNDIPLGIVPYVGRHLSTFLTGHLEGVLTPLWAWILLLLLPIIVVLTWPDRGDEDASLPQQRSPHLALAYLALCLFIPLAIGFIQQLRAPFIPDRFERVLLFAAPAFWLLIALGLRRLARESLPAAILVAAFLLFANIASLFAFYTTPRYAAQDYRSLIRTVQLNAVEGDSVLTLFPWQAGYFWSYLPAGDRPDIVSSSDLNWSPHLQKQLDDLLEQGAVWFPEHLALGGILETAAEDHLSQQAYQLLNRWYGEETRLTGWVKPGAKTMSVELTTPIKLTTPITWSNGLTLDVAHLAGVPDQARLLFDFDWTGTQDIDPTTLTLSLWMTDPQGVRWAQRDVTPFAHPYPPLDAENRSNSNQDRIALTLPLGTPPGEYDIWIALLDESLSPLPLAGANPAPQAWLGVYEAPDLSPPGRAAVINHARQIAGEGIEFLGHDHDLGSYLSGDDLAVSLYWRPTSAIASDLNGFLQLLDNNGAVVAGFEGPPIAWLPTSAWKTNAAIRSQLSLRIPADLQPGGYQLIAGLFDPASGERIIWGGDDHVRLVEITTQARDHDFEPPSPRIPLDLSLAGGHQLIGYDLVAGDSAGSPINLVLYWAPATATEQRYSTFVHLLDPDDAILSQSDNEPAHGESPTTAWLQGEYIVDPHTLTFPLDAPPGPYRLQVGLYHPPTGQRLPFVDQAGTVLTDHIVLPIN